MSLSCMCSRQWVLGSVDDLWFLLHYQYWALIRIPLVYPVVSPCQGELAALGLQDQPLQVLQQILDRVDVETQSPGSGPG